MYIVFTVTFLNIVIVLSTFKVLLIDLGVRNESMCALTVNSYDLFMYLDMHAKRIYTRIYQSNPTNRSHSRFYHFNTCLKIPCYYKYDDIVFF
jgi:hypothetical protein